MFLSNLLGTAAAFFNLCALSGCFQEIIRRFQKGLTLVSKIYLYFIPLVIRTGWIIKNGRLNWIVSLDSSCAPCCVPSAPACCQWAGREVSPWACWCSRVGRAAGPDLGICGTAWERERLAEGTSCQTSENDCLPYLFFTLCILCQDGSSP